jgi:hypothetical protein
MSTAAIERSRLRNPGAIAAGMIVLTRAAAATSVTLALICNSVDARARDRREASSAPVALAHVTLADIEDAFWTCDYVATTRGPVGDLERCSAVYDALKELKFGGDFGQLVLWWSRHKLAEHARIEEAARRDVGVRR